MLMFLSWSVIAPALGMPDPTGDPAGDPARPRKDPCGNPGILPVFSSSSESLSSASLPSSASIGSSSSSFKPLRCSLLLAKSSSTERFRNRFCVLGAPSGPEVNSSPSLVASVSRWASL